MSQSREREQYLTAQEVAARLGLAPSAVVRYYREGRIPGRRIAGRGADGALPVERGRCGVGLRAAAHGGGRDMRSAAEEPESIRALATVTLDANALDELGPQTLERLADLVAERLAAREAAGQVPLLKVADAAKVAGVGVDTVRKAIRSGELEVAGYVGQRARLRRADLEAWLGSNAGPVTAQIRPPDAGPPRRRARTSHSHVLGEALIGVDPAAVLTGSD